MGSSGMRQTTMSISPPASAGIRMSLVASRTVTTMAGDWALMAAMVAGSRYAEAETMVPTTTWPASA